MEKKTNTAGHLLRCDEIVSLRGIHRVLAFRRERSVRRAIDEPLSYVPDDGPLRA